MSRHPRALCALAAGAALLITATPTLASDVVVPDAHIGEAVVAPATTRYATATDSHLWLPGEDSVARLDRGSLATMDTLTPTTTGVEALVATDEGVWAAVPREHVVLLLDQLTGQEVRRVVVDAAPYALAATGSDLWIADFDGGQVLRVDRVSGDTLATIAGIGGPTGVAVGDDGIWVAANASSRVVRIDPATGDVVSQVIVPGKPHSIAVGAGGVWTANGSIGTVTRVDPATGEVTATVHLDAPAYDVEVVGDSVWVTSAPDGGACGTAGVVARIDPTTNEVAEALSFPCAWALIADRDSLWVSGSDERGTLLAEIAR